MSIHRYEVAGVERTVRVSGSRDGGLEVRDGDSAHAVHVCRRDAGFLSLAIDGRRVSVHTAKQGGVRLVFRHGRVYRLGPPAPARRVAAASDAALEAPMPATVVRLEVAPGDLVEKGQVLVVLEAMKMAHEILAPRAGRVTAVHCEAGGLVDGGVKLVELASEA